MREPAPEVRAAGGIVLRSAAGRDRIAVVHRPRYDDWSLPKGKLQGGESLEDAARREVLEETGFAVELGGALPPVTYEDRAGRRKVVHYFRMVATAGVFTPNEEVDELRWLEPADAVATLTYEHDRDLVRSLEGP